MLIFLLALGVRFYQVTYHSLWFDEAVSLHWAEQSAARIWQVGMALSEDKHPPFYYLLLHFWTALFGNSDLASRSLGVLFGALLTVPIYRIGKRLAGPEVAIIAALLVAINPFLVWYSQEARMFVLATTFALVGLDAWLDSLARPRPLPALIYVVSTLVALYSYLLTALLVPVAALLALFAWLGWFSTFPVNGIDLPKSAAFSPKVLLFALGSLATVTLGFAPLAWQYWRVAEAESRPGQAFAGFAPWLGRLLEAYTLRSVNWPSAQVQAIVLLAAVGLLLGLLWASPHLLVFIVTYIALSLLLTGFLVARNADFLTEDRYFLFLIPALTLAWAAVATNVKGQVLGRIGQTNPLRWAALGILLVVIGSQGTALPQLWTPAQRRENWRAASVYVTAYAGPQDAVLLHVDYIRVAFLHYFKRPLALYFPFIGSIESIDQIDPPLRGIQGYDTIWLVESHTGELDPNRLVEAWLRQTYPLVTEQYPTGIRVIGFVTRPTYPALPPQAHPPLQPFAAATASLAGCTASPTVQARDDVAHPPSGWLHVTLYWQTQQPLPTDYRPQVRLTDFIGQVWGEALDRAAAPLKRLPSSHWPPGALVRDEQDINLNPVTPPGAYQVSVALLDTDGKPLPGASGLCSAVTVLP